MKDLVITRNRIAREARILAGCALLALLANVCAIIAYKTRWSELITAWRATLGLALVLYVLFAFLRLALAGMKRLFRRRIR